MQPLIFDHVNKVVIQVGTTPEAAKRYEELVAAQVPASSTGVKGL